MIIHSVVSGLRAYALSESSVAAKRLIIAFFAVSVRTLSDIPALNSEKDMLGCQHMGIRHVYARRNGFVSCSVSAATLRDTKVDFICIQMLQGHAE